MRSVPEKVDGGALEHGEKEENDANGSGQYHGGVEDVGVDTVHGDAEEGDDNRELGDNTGQHVEKLTYPPALKLCEHVIPRPLIVDMVIPALRGGSHFLFRFGQNKPVFSPIHIYMR